MTRSGSFRSSDMCLNDSEATAMSSAGWPALDVRDEGPLSGGERPFELRLRMDGASEAEPERVMGFEPTTSSLGSWRSTN